jgi:hypothetical protein
MLGIGIMRDAAGIGNPKSVASVRYFYRTGTLYFGDKLFPASAFFYFGTGLTGFRSVRHSGIFCAVKLRLLRQIPQ